MSNNQKRGFFIDIQKLNKAKTTNTNKEAVYKFINYEEEQEPEKAPLFFD